MECTIDRMWCLCTQYNSQTSYYAFHIWQHDMDFTNTHVHRLLCMLMVLQDITYIPLT